MDQASQMLVRLNLETRTYHGAADAGWRSLLTPSVDATAYIEQLVRVYGFEGPLEAAFAYTPHLELVIGVHERYRAGYIAQDLIALQRKPGEVARLPQCVIAPFSSPLEALGWMYVSERWTLLHDEVRRYLSVRLPAAAHACVYLSANEGHVNARWQAFGHAIDNAVRTPRMADEVVSGAHGAFRAWLDWTARETTTSRTSIAT